jgi:hypothetical protein
MRGDYGIETLLDLDGQIIHQGGGYWIKIEAWRVTPTRKIPHGIRYSLTLHEPYGKRILGYDNAHAVRRPRRHKYSGHVVEHDHKHPSPADTAVAYEFSSPYQLLSDFFADVDRVLREVSKR